MSEARHYWALLICGVYHHLSSIIFFCVTVWKVYLKHCLLKCNLHTFCYYYMSMSLSVHVSLPCKVSKAGNVFHLFLPVSCEHQLTLPGVTRRNGLHYIARWSKAVYNLYLTFTYSYTLSFTDEDVNHARQQPADWKQLGLDVLLKDTRMHICNTPFQVFCGEMRVKRQVKLAAYLSEGIVGQPAQEWSLAALKSCLQGLSGI